MRCGQQRQGRQAHERGRVGALQAAPQAPLLLHEQCRLHRHRAAHLCHQQPAHQRLHACASHRGVLHFFHAPSPLVEETFPLSQGNQPERPEIGEGASSLPVTSNHWSCMPNKQAVCEGWIRPFASICQDAVPLIVLFLRAKKHARNWLLPVL